MTTVASPPRIVATVREFVERDVRPTAPAPEHADQVERYYRDAAGLVVSLGGNDGERRVLADRLRGEA